MPSVVTGPDSVFASTMSNRYTLVVREIDPGVDLLALQRHSPVRYPFLLESAASGTAQGRFDILFAFPGATLAAESGLSGDFLRDLDVRFVRECAVADAGDLPFRGGWFVFLGYELAAQIEPRLAVTADSTLPVAFAVRVSVAVIYCHLRDRAWVVAETGHEHRIEQIERDIAASAALEFDMHGTLADRLEEEPERAYIDAVRRAQRYIYDGDIFQANLSREWRARSRALVDDAQIYARLREANPAPFAGLVRWGDAAIISSSPERLLVLRDGVAETRPIAGTRPRGPARDRDIALSRELIGNPKERAEHVMLIDLERNDLGRVCRPGTVSVDELMVVESYAHVHHIVSNVRGRLRDDITPGEAIRAVFPGGTITGCPKVRCMEIISELERCARGAYTGSIGYLNRDGSADLNILIRTMVRHRDELRLRAGAGIVADSDPEGELAETRSKARGLLIALGFDA